LKDETKFPRRSNLVTIQCSGTGRIEQIHEYPGDGDELINTPKSFVVRNRISALLTIAWWGGRHHWDCKVVRCLAEESHQILRRGQRPVCILPPWISWSRNILQKGGDLQLCGVRALAKS
jgi:hypothetical protein